ncbi:MAG: tRNA preQ1(34) S-adenosylmethionine ribosyltransferase-isomerase QueA [Lentisphaeria bacterium]|jgi:S-adenosylmethionine:tRNA ribosyltransferase-isomerase
MRLSEFQYELPPELIAQRPLADRAAARMLVLDRATGECALRTFRDFPSFIRPGDCLVFNDTKVIPARLFARREPSGGRVELLLLEELAPGRWKAMARPGRRLHPGDRLRIEGVAAEPELATLGAKLPEGLVELHFATPDVLGLLDRAGAVPLPPYIARPADQADEREYQTIYAARPGAVAAPTAGLHFTPATLEALRANGAESAHVTLHVGPGTFRPVQAERIEDHVMHEEPYELPDAAAAAINAARARGGRIVAIGTTSVRVLETCADPDRPGYVRPGRGRTRLFLHPPLRPRVADALLTNFHLPGSTLLMLVSSFSSVEHVLAAYRLAVRERLRFFSYGDCMLLL